MKAKFYLQAIIVGLAFAAALTIIVTAIERPMLGQPVASNQAQPIQLSPEETSQWQILMLQQENLRLAVCLRVGAIGGECGTWGRGAVVMRNPRQADKPAETAAVPNAHQVPKAPEAAKVSPAPIATPKQ